MLVLYSDQKSVGYGFLIVPKMVILNNLEPRVQVVQQCAAILATAAVLSKDVSRRQRRSKLSWSRGCCWPTFTQQMACKYGSWNLNENAPMAVVQ